MAETDHVPARRTGEFAPEYVRAFQPMWKLGGYVVLAVTGSPPAGLIVGRIGWTFQCW
jgi:hypothetical protein